MENTIIDVDGNAKTTNGLTGSVINVTGTLDKVFLEAVGQLMEEHQINYVHLFWSKYQQDLRRRKRKGGKPYKRCPKCRRMVFYLTNAIWFCEACGYQENV